MQVLKFVASPSMRCSICPACCSQHVPGKSKAQTEATSFFSCSKHGLQQLIMPGICSAFSHLPAWRLGGSTYEGLKLSPPSPDMCRDTVSVIHTPLGWRHKCCQGNWFSVGTRDVPHWEKAQTERVALHFLSFSFPEPLWTAYILWNELKRLIFFCLWCDVHGIM